MPFHLMKSLGKKLASLLMIPITTIAIGCSTPHKNPAKIYTALEYEKKSNEILRLGQSDEIDKRIDEQLGLKHRATKKEKKSKLKTEDYLFGCVIAGQIGDYITTKMLLNNSGRELNPLIGEHPSDTTLLLLKGGTILAFYGLGQLIPKHKKTIYKGGCVLGIGLTSWGIYQLSK